MSTRPTPSVTDLLEHVPGLSGLLQRERRAADAYADAVMDVLRGEFPGLADPIDSHVVRDSITRNYLSPTGPFEVIIDSPSAANWRLKPHPSRPGRVRLADYALTRIHAPHEREARVNTLLDQIP